MKGHKKDKQEAIQKDNLPKKSQTVRIQKDQTEGPLQYLDHMDQARSPTKSVWIDLYLTKVYITI